MFVRALSVTILTFSTLMFYSIIDFTPISHPVQKSRSSKIRTIVSYSLEKKLQLQGRSVQCIHPVVFPNLRDDDEWIRVPDTRAFIRSAFLDIRLHPYLFIRIIAMIQGEWDVKLYCHIISAVSSHTVEATVTHMWLPEWNQGTSETYEPVMVSCKLPQGIKSARAVAISEKPCHNPTPMIYLPKDITTTVTSTNFTTNEPITVCVKPLQFTNDISTKLIAWIEMNKLLGAAKIEFYYTNVHPRTLRTLKWYEGQTNTSSSVRLKRYRPLADDKMIIDGGDVWQKRRNEVIAYNDCLYRNINTSRFVVPVDIDEIIVPKHEYTWRQLLSHLFQLNPQLQNNYASFVVRNAYFMDQFTRRNKRSKYSIPFLDNIVRSELSPDGESGKSFVSTANTHVVFNHYALVPLKPGIQKAYFLPSDLVQMNHYRNSCSTILLAECAKYLSSPIRIVDTSMFRYKKMLKNNIFTVIKLLNL